MRQGSIGLEVSDATMVGQTMGASFNSDPVNLISIYAYSIQVSWSGGSVPVGTFKLQGSNDPGDNGSGQGVSAPANYTDIVSSAQSISGTPGSILFDVTQCGYRWVRLAYTRTSGTTSVTVASMNVKGV